MIQQYNSSTYPDKTPIQKNSCTPIFIAALYTIDKTWKEPKCPLKDEWIKDVICIYNGMLLNHKNNEIMPLAATWIELESIMLSEESQKEKDKHMIPHVWNYDTDQEKKNKQTHRQREQICGCQRGVWEDRDV